MTGYAYKLPKFYGDRVIYGKTLPDGAIVIRVFTEGT